MPPTPLAMIFTATSSVASLFNASRNASALPCTSVLSRMAMLPIFCSSIWPNTSSHLRGLLREFHVAELALAIQRDFARLAFVFDREDFVAGVRRALQAEHLHGHRRRRARSRACRSRRTCARTRPNSLPAMIGSPSFSVPFFTSTVATAPRPFSMEASMTTPVAQAIGRGLELEHFGLQQDGVEQLVDALAGLRRHGHEHACRRPIPRR